MTLTEQIIIKRNEGLSAIETLKWLRDNNMPVQWVEVRSIYSALENQKK